MKFIVRKMKVVDAVSEAVQYFTEVGEELQEGFDNLPEGLQNGEKAQARQEAADALSSLSEISFPATFEDVSTQFSFPERTLKQISNLPKATRVNDGVVLLNQVLEWVKKIIEDDESDDEAQTLHDELEQLIDEVEAIEF